MPGPGAGPTRLHRARTVRTSRISGVCPRPESRLWIHRGPLGALAPGDRCAVSIERQEPARPAFAWNANSEPTRCVAPGRHGVFSFRAAGPAAWQCTRSCASTGRAMHWQHAQRWRYGPPTAAAQLERPNGKREHAQCKVGRTATRCKSFRLNRRQHEHHTREGRSERGRDPR